MVVEVIPLLLPWAAIFFAFLWLRRKKEKSSMVLSGNRGLPILGETISFFKPHPASTMGDFMQDHISRYGKIFSSSLMGRRAIISVDAELNRFVQNNDAKLFTSAWLPSFRGIFGKESLTYAFGETHKRLRSTILNFLSMKRLQTVFLKDIDLIASALIKSWKDGQIISAKDEAIKYSLQIMAKSALSIMPDDPDMVALKRNYEHFMPALISFPINIPGMTYWKALKGRRNILKVIRKIIKERTAKSKDYTVEKVEDEGFIKDEAREEDCDLLDWLVTRTKYTKEAIEDILLGLLFAAHDTTSKAITFMLHLLVDCPEVVKMLQVEHLQIAQSKSKVGRNLSWDDYKNMEFTKCVINEALRLSNVAPFTPKKAMEDVQYRGMVIPKGTLMIVHLRAVHLHPSHYDNPMHFNPWRWLGPSIKRNNFMPFGGGVRMCPGASLAKLEMAVFLHHIILNYEWEIEERDHPMSVPYLEYHKGLPIKIHTAYFKRLL